MSSDALLRVDRFMRSVHLYTGLFLVPWMTVYATSSLFFNHSPWFARWFSYSRQSLEVVRKLDLPAGSIPTGNPAEQARKVLLAPIFLQPAAQRVLGVPAKRLAAETGRVGFDGLFVAQEDRVVLRAAVRKAGASRTCPSPWRFHPPESRPCRWRAD